ncbi:MAG: hypothetical protein WA317_09370 [Mycobacterium sp.]|uniref:hypothetical protein n=1 Tax=Mycobacterium sp. TaxID=1785 RepID=UPI003CC50D06
MAGTDIRPVEFPEESSGWETSIFTDCALPDPALIVTLWLTAPIPGYGVAPDGAKLTTSPSDAHASAACTVANGADDEFAAHDESDPAGAT